MTDSPGKTTSIVLKGVGGSLIVETVPDGLGWCKCYFQNAEKRIYLGAGAGTAITSKLLSMIGNTKLHSRLGDHLRLYETHNIIEVRAAQHEQEIYIDNAEGLSEPVRVGTILINQKQISEWLAQLKYFRRMPAIPIIRFVQPENINRYTAKLQASVYSNTADVFPECYLLQVNNKYGGAVCKYLAPHRDSDIIEKLELIHSQGDYPYYIVLPEFMGAGICWIDWWGPIRTENELNRMIQTKTRREDFSGLLSWVKNHMVNDTEAFLDLSG